MNRRLKLFGFCNRGYNGQAIEIECDIRSGFPGFEIIGLPDATVRESRERVKTALRNCGFKFPQQKVLVSLSPASVPKQGSLLDLAIAMSILFASKKDATEELRVMVAGELNLDGRVIESSETLTAVDAARKCNCQLCILPCKANIENVIEAKTLTQVFIEIGENLNSAGCIKSFSVRKKEQSPIFSDIIGLSEEKEILAMASSGFHSTLLFGPPGVGKTMLSNRLSLLLPKPELDQIEEIKRIYGCAGINIDLCGSNSNDLYKIRRILSHDCTHNQFVGGVNSKSPGEGALSHRGTLILDEIDKYTPKLLETIKDSYDKGYTQSSRSGELVTYPARFLMVANMNTCSCGGLGNPNAVCTCTSQKLQNHWKRVGSQLLQRFDIRLPIKIQDNMLLSVGKEQKEDSYYIDKVQASAERQKNRYKSYEDVSYNGEVHFDAAALFELTDEINLYNKLYSNLGADSRYQIGMISLARTIADFNDRSNTLEEDFKLAEELKRYGLGDYYWKKLN